MRRWSVCVASVVVVVGGGKKELETVLKECESLDADGCWGLLSEVAVRDGRAHLYLGLVAQQREPADTLEATRQYEACLGKAKDVDCLNNLGRIVSEQGDKARALSLWQQALEQDPLHKTARSNLALHWHGEGRYREALKEWDFVLRKDPTDAEALYNAAVSWQYLGDVTHAATLYAAAVDLRPEYPEALVNLAALHHRYGSVSDAVFWYQSALKVAWLPKDLEVMIRNNLGVAFSQLGDSKEAVAQHVAAKETALTNGFTGDEIDLADGHVLKARIPVCDWRDRDESVARLVASDADRIRRGRAPILLPFDTLLVPLDGETRLRHAVAQAAEFARFQTHLPTPHSEPNLKVAYMSYDFNEHPTAHLVEGLFKWHARRRQISAIAVSYGKDDGSTYRKEIAKYASNFIDVASLGYEDAVLEARRPNPLVAVDLQGHTLGTRMELAAMRVAPIQASYLIFPGTTGAGFVDLLILDKIVQPPETSIGRYSEKLVYLPNSYQVNDYERHLGGIDTAMTMKQLRNKAGLPAEGFVFCNFNKNDKLDPESFRVWTNVLRRVPRSVLWMLRPSKEKAFAALKANLRAEAASRGVDPNRLIFADRVPKADHLARHRAADLFLDTFVYGAHSTATDALRGGLPFLTLAGDTFPQRVGLSLLDALEHVDHRRLVAAGRQDFEDLAVQLATDRLPELRALTRRLRTSGPASPLFDTAAFTANIERAFKAAWDVFQADANRSTRHIILLAAE